LVNLGLVAFVAGCLQSSPGPENTGRANLLERGWEFACALTNHHDAAERGEAQEKVVRAALKAGDPEKALMFGRQINDWRRCLALIKVAEWHVDHGQQAKAEAMLPEIHMCRMLAKEWQMDLYRVDLVRLQALLGRQQEVLQAVSNLTGSAQLGGDALGRVALLYARAGRVDDAEVILKNLGETKGLDIAAVRAQGYLNLVESGRIEARTAPDALTNAWAATASVRPYRQWELQVAVVREMATHGLKAEARAHLEPIGSNVVAAVNMPPEVRAGILSEGAGCWVKLGEPLRGIELLRAAEESVHSRLEPMFRPGAWARLAEGYMAAGDLKQARALYARALDIATGLEHLRPRALAGVDVCVSLAGHGEVVNADIQQRLERLAATFPAGQP
jgi:tetratricopeptide (TPR) repeat protein